MRQVLRHLRGALSRVFPDATPQSQAVAFNMFLSFFPLLLLVLGVLTTTRFWGAGVEEVHSRLITLLPPGSKRLVVDYLVHQGASPLKWGIVGLVGTVLVGTQVMVGLLQGVQLVHRENTLGRWWKQQLRGLILLLICIGPWLAAVVITVFGRQVRRWMIGHFGLPGLFNGIWIVVYLGLVLVLAVLVLSAIYRAGRPTCRGWNEVLPGAVVATVLWWVANSVFGFYVRNVPYGAIYGGLAAAIGLLIWMNLSVLVVFLGAGYNAEALPPSGPPETPTAPSEEEEVAPASAPHP